jgi:exopolysaccharide production protein ExoQ
LTQIATLICVFGILGLFLFNWDSEAKTSKALWIPLIWLLIAGSRNIGEWLQSGTPLLVSDNPYVEGNAIDRNLLAGLVALGVIVLIRRRHAVGKILSANWAILLFLVYCLVSVYWSDFPYVGFKRWIRFSGDLVMVLVILSDRDWLAARKKILAWPAFVLLPLSILFIRYYPNLGRTYSRWDYFVSWTGVSTTKNGLGMISMIFGLAAASRLFDLFGNRQEPNRLRRVIAHGTIFAMALYLIQVAHSATSLACFILGGAVLVLTSWRAVARWPGLIHILLGSLLFISYASLFIIPGSGLLEVLGRNSTLTGRTDVWTRVVTLVRSPAFGTGFESFWIGSRLAEMRLLDPGLNQAHNGYLEIYLNLGWVGLTLLAIVILAGYRNAISAFHRDPNTARLRLVYFVIALSYNFTEGAFKMMDPIWILFLLSTIALPAVATEESPVVLPEPFLQNTTFAKPKPQVDDALVARFPHKRTT